MRKNGEAHYEKSSLSACSPGTGSCTIRLRAYPDRGRRKPVDYTVVERQDIPAALDEIMNEKKEKEFQLSYETGEALYLAKGYGRQMSGGYSIQVEELGASSNGLFFVTRLIGPKDLNEAGVPSYPCIVIKTEPQKKPVVFREGKADSGSEKGE